jgi:hypothetical protein
MSKEIVPVWDKAEIKYNNHEFFTNQFRLLLTGSSGDGKTVLLNRLLLTKMLDYDILFLFTPSVQQASYQILINGINLGLTPAQILGIYANQDKIHDYMYAINYIVEQLKQSNHKLKPFAYVIAHDKIKYIPKPEDIRKEAIAKAKSIWPEKYEKEKDDDLKVLVCIDDAICSSQTKINKVFVYGRVFNLNIIYLTQAYFETSKGCTRTNVNTWILYKQSDSDLKRIYNNVNKGEVTYQQFIELCNKAWSNKRGFVLIVRHDASNTKYINGEEVINEIRKREHILYPIA